MFEGIFSYIRTYFTISTAGIKNFSNREKLSICNQKLMFVYICMYVFIVIIKDVKYLF